MRKFSIAASSLLLAGLAVCALAADWPEHRGGPARLGSIDDKAGPKTPKVIWALKSPGHFLSCPVPTDKLLLVSGMAALGTGQVQCLAIDPAAAQRIEWTKASPDLKRPSVCSPVISGELAIFGDGMHQTDDASMSAVLLATGRPIWTYAVPGRLVHIECSPVVEGGKVYFSAGAAGVIALDTAKLTLDGKEADLAAVKSAVTKRMAELKAKYEQDKLRDPTAEPPGDRDLPHATPKLLWQKGKEEWHVDSPLLLAGGKIIVGSAYIEEDQVGKRSLYCLDAADGSVKWERALKTNPWGGATLAGKLAIVACSSIRYDRKLIKQAAGEVVAVDIETGTVAWRAEVPGGVLGSVAVSGGMAVFAATDGKVRCLDAATGEARWKYEQANPFFAGVAISGGAVYAADLKGTLHAINLADGKGLWTFDVLADPAVQAGGSFYASPTVQAGMIYLATCNIDNDAAAQAQSAVICVGDVSQTIAAKPGAAIAVDKEKKTVTIPCKVAQRKLPNLAEVYPLEVGACYAAPQGQKAHETIVTIEARPWDVHAALESLGLKPGTPSGGEAAATGPQVLLFLELPDAIGRARLVPLEKAMVDKRTGKPLPEVKWMFTGSVMRQPNPEKDLKVYAADIGGTLITIFPVTDETVIQSDFTTKHSASLRLEVNRNIVPDEGTACKLVIKVPQKP